jgi:hypothetical protein
VVRASEGGLIKSAPVTSVCLLKTLGEAGAEFDTPETNRFAADSDTAFSLEIFHILVTASTRLSLNRQ